jgi:gas vesicle protein
MFKIGHVLTLIAGVVLGSLAGSMVGVLYAPQSGEKTRRQIQQSARQAGSKVRQTIDDLQFNAQRLVDQVEYDALRRTDKLVGVGRKLVSEQRNSLKRGVRQAKSILTS